MGKVRKIIIRAVIGFTLLAFSFAAFADPWQYEFNALGQRLDQLEKEARELEEDFDWAGTELGEEKIAYLRYKFADLQKDIDFSRDKRRRFLALVNEARAAIMVAQTPEEKKAIKERYDSQIEKLKAEIEAEYDNIGRRLSNLRGELEKVVGDVRELKARHEQRLKLKEKALEMAKPIWERGKISLEVASFKMENDFSESTIGLRFRNLLVNSIDAVVRVNGVIEEEETKQTVVFLSLESRKFGFENLRLVPGIEVKSINWELFPSFGLIWEGEHQPDPVKTIGTVGWYLLAQWVLDGYRFGLAFTF